MIHWLAGRPAYVLFPMFIVVGLIVTLALDAFVRRFVADDTRERATHTAGVMLQVTATVYAILIGFVIVDEYTRISDTQAQVSSKAAALAVIDANTLDLPRSEGARIRAATAAYARVALRSEIPRLNSSEANRDEVTDRSVARLFVAVQASDPSTPAEEAAYESSLRALDTVVATKAELLDSSRAALPPTLLWMLFGVGIGVMAVATLLDTKHRRAHLFMVATLGLVIWVTFAMVVSLDYAFGGIVHVSDEPIRFFLAATGR